MLFSIASVVVLLSFNVGPVLGAFIPVQEQGDPWRTSALFGLKARYELSAVDMDFQLVFTQLRIDPDSSRGYDYSMVPVSLGLSGKAGFLRYGTGAALYSIEAKKEITEGLESVWSGTYPGMYLSFGKDFAVGSNKADITARFNIINFDGLWVGLSTSFLF